MNRFRTVMCGIVMISFVLTLSGCDIGYDRGGYRGYDSDQTRSDRDYTRGDYLGYDRNSNGSDKNDRRGGGDIYRSGRNSQ